MIPPFSDSGNLPEGIHDATWDEIVDRFGTSERRRTLLEGLRRALDSLRQAGCRRAYLDGSFVTAREEPGDFDACWETAGVSVDLLDPVLLTFANRRNAQKERFGGELFPADWTETRTVRASSITSSETRRPASPRASSLSIWRISRDHQ